MDYAEHTTAITRIRRQMYDALLHGDWNKAADLADELAIEAHKIRLWCLIRLDNED